MREIKFRAWDSKQKQMCYDVNVYSEKAETWWTADWLEETGNNIASFDARTGTLIESIGRKDIDDKHIFLGDIVKYTREREKIAEVKWDDQGACYMFGEDEIGENISDIEVIGNIYENPELLESPGA